MPFQPGQGGRPRGASNRGSAEVRDVLAKLGTKGKDDLHAKRLHQLTLSDDEHVSIKALAIVMAYRHGKPTEHVQLGGAGGGPVRIEFVIVGA